MITNASRFTKAGWAAAGAASGVLLVIGAILVTVVGINPFSANADDGDDTPASVVASCDDVEGNTPTFYNQQTDDLAFGPAVETQVDPAVAELHKRRCQDPALTTAHAIDAGLEGWDFKPTDAEWQEQWTRLNGDRELWLSVIAQLEAQEKSEETTVEVVNYPHSYHTMWFLDGPEGQFGKLPFLRQGPGHASEAGMVLKFTFKDGSVRMYRLSCGFQPVRETPFPNVPPVEEPPCDCPPPPPVTTVPPSTTVPGTSVPPKACPPGTIWDDKDHDGKVDEGECIPPNEKPPVTTVAPPPVTVTAAPTTTLFIPPTAPPDVPPGPTSTVEPTVPDRPVQHPDDPPTQSTAPATVAPAATTPNTSAPPNTGVPPSR